MTSLSLIKKTGQIKDRAAINYRYISDLKLKKNSYSLDERRSTELKNICASNAKT